MKTFLAVVGSLVVFVVLAVGAGAWYFARQANAAASKIENQMVEDFVAKHHPSQETQDVLARIKNRMAQPHGVLASGLSLMGLSVLALPDAVTLEQQAMLQEVANLLDKDDLSMAQIGDFQRKYKDVLPQQGRAPHLGAPAPGAASASQPNGPAVVAPQADVPAAPHAQPLHHALPHHQHRHGAPAAH